jgi:ketosteroid isomerase-like protein
MSTEANTQIVRQAYEAFGSGNIPALLNLVDEQVDWMAIVGAGSKVPTAGARRGRAQVQEFFQTLSKTVDFKRFEPREYVAERDKVVALGFYEGTAKSTGRSWSSDWVMIFTVRDGKIVHFREFTDVMALTAAF